jgi:predicted N-acetyltransferase YhbS
MLIRPERPSDAAAIERLLDLAFGPERNRKTAYRLREGVPPVRDLSSVAVDGDALIGTLRFWPILAGGRGGLLLGPFAIRPQDQGRGLGRRLMRHGIGRAAQLGYGSIILVGDPAYYAQFGFTRQLTLGLTLPGPVDLDRFLGLELKPGSLGGARGMVEPAASEVGRPAAAREERRAAG